MSLADVLELARPRADGIEVAFRGADEGEVAGGRRVRFGRAFPSTSRSTRTRCSFGAWAAGGWRPSMERPFA